MSTAPGKSVLVDDPSELPPALVTFADREGLGDQDRGEGVASLVQQLVGALAP